MEMLPTLSQSLTDFRKTVGLRETRASCAMYAWVVISGDLLCSSKFHGLDVPQLLSIYTFRINTIANSGFGSISGQDGTILAYEILEACFEQKAARRRRFCQMYGNKESIRNSY
jgi:hypothetical protein